MNSPAAAPSTPPANSARSPRFLATLGERKDGLQRALAPIFSATTEFVCEFGSGHGHFLVAYAKAHPTDVCVGVDIDPNRTERANRKQVRAKASRLHFIQADAGLFLQMLPAAASFRRVFILFPDPWPKKRHHKHRLIQTAFLDELRRRSSAHTRIYFRTDYAPYFENALNCFTRHAGWEIAEEPWPFEHETVFQSRADSFQSLVAKPRRGAS